MDKIEIHDKGCVYHVDREATMKSDGWIRFELNSLICRIVPSVGDPKIWIVVEMKEPHKYPTATYLAGPKNG